MAFRKSRRQPHRILILQNPSTKNVNSQAHRVATPAVEPNRKIIYDGHATRHRVPLQDLIAIPVTRAHVHPQTPSPRPPAKVLGGQTKRAMLSPGIPPPAQIIRRHIYAQGTLAPRPPANTFRAQSTRQRVPGSGLTGDTSVLRFRAGRQLRALAHSPARPPHPRTKRHALRLAGSGPKPILSRYVGKVHTPRPAGSVLRHRVPGSGLDLGGPLLGGRNRGGTQQSAQIGTHAIGARRLVRIGRGLAVVITPAATAAQPISGLHRTAGLKRIATGLAGDRSGLPAGNTRRQRVPGRESSGSGIARRLAASPQPSPRTGATARARLPVTSPILWPFRVADRTRVAPAPHPGRILRGPRPSAGLDSAALAPARRQSAPIAERQPRRGRSLRHGLRGQGQGITTIPRHSGVAPRPAARALQPGQALRRLIPAPQGIQPAHRRADRQAKGFPWQLRGKTRRQDVPGIGLVAAYLVYRRTVSHGVETGPASGRADRRGVPRLALVPAQIVPRHGLTVPAAFPIERLRGRKRRGITFRTGDIVLGPYYVVAGQLWCAGAVAGQIV